MKTLENILALADSNIEKGGKVCQRRLYLGMI
jgi:hypothetical protein